MSIIWSKITENFTVCSKACSGWQQKTSKLHYRQLCTGNPTITVGFPICRACSTERVYMLWHHHVFSQLSVPLFRFQSIYAQLIPIVGLYSVLNNQLVFTQAPRLLPDPSIPQIHTDSFIMRCQLAMIDWQSYYWCRLGQTKSLMSHYRIGNYCVWYFESLVQNYWMSTA